MAGITKVRDVVWTTVNLLTALRQRLAERNAAEDARRAQAARLFWSQNWSPSGIFGWQVLESR